MTQLAQHHRLRLPTFRTRLFLILVLAIALLIIPLTGCSPSQARTAAQRTFLDFSLDFLGEYELPKMTYKDTPVGGLSALTYDRQRNKFYALSDDRSNLAPARFYTLGLVLNNSETGDIKLEKINVEDVTFITDENNKPFDPGSLDPEGISLSPRGTVFISSEGVPSQGIAPFIREFDLKTGQQRSSLLIPERYLPNDQKEDESPRGLQENLGFESLSLELGSLSTANGDPFRLFTATESSLIQDSIPPNSEQSAPLRLLHYLIGNIARPMVVAEHVYFLDPTPKGAIDNGLTDLVTVDTGGHFLSLERTYSLLGANAKIYQLATGAATDTSGIPSLKDNRSKVEPIKKKLLLDLSELGIYLDNLEGMALGPKLPDGRQSLLLVSDNNFSNTQVTQFLLFRLKQG
ncbi:MAG TPA: esterase-like activity of phytase family protein [Coleofasciculaceae cyanobacterium]